MKLYYSPTSPYARKVRVVIRERGLEGQVTEVQMMPADKPPELLAANPLGKVPALIVDDNEVLYDSPVICEYLDQLGPGSLLVPVGRARWPALRAQALADGLTDIAVMRVMEQRRPENEQSESSRTHWFNQMQSAVESMHLELAALEGELSIGHIAIAVALGYLDFRLPDFEWNNRADQALTDWYAEFSSRRSMQDTVPPRQI